MTLPTSEKNKDFAYLDSLIADALNASTSAERAAKIREWLLSNPSFDALSHVFKGLSSKDKGAAKLVRERFDEVKRANVQDALVDEWARKASVLLDATKFHIADAIAWQRDAAKAGAPLSKDPLAALKIQLTDKVQKIEDLQHRVQVQREAAVLLSQRIDVLSTKPLSDAQLAREALRADVSHWQIQATQLTTDQDWPSVDIKFPVLLDASRSQLLAVSEAFEAALALAMTAAQDASAILPPVPVWADELRAAREAASQAMHKKPSQKVDASQRASAFTRVSEALEKLELEMAQGHGKASSGAASALRLAFKECGKLIDDRLESKVRSALVAATELGAWQRWRADQLREELIAQAQGLLVERSDGQAVGGRKIQESLRTLREQWKLTDQGGSPNHALWKRFDEACNKAHQRVEIWLEKVKVQMEEHKAQRLALIEELTAWAKANPTALNDDWKGFNYCLHQFGARWRQAGHVGEKLFAELQPLWQVAMSHAAAPLENLQQKSLISRQSMIEEAKVLGAAPVLRIDALKALQQRWQAEAHRVPLDRKQEIKLWDAFKKPIDDAFQRKTVERERVQASMGERDRSVLDAVKALEAATSQAEAHVIRRAMSALEEAVHGSLTGIPGKHADKTMPTSSVEIHAGANSSSQLQALDSTASATPQADSVPVSIPKPTPKPVIAVRGDDRPGIKKEAQLTQKTWASDKSASTHGGRKLAPRAGTHSQRFAEGDTRAAVDVGRNRAPIGQEMPRLGDIAFRAQRDALVHARAALRALAVHAHDDALSQLLKAWERRDANLLPAAQELGSQVTSAARSSWVQAVGAPISSQDALLADTQNAILRLEIAAEIPSPDENLAARRALQLQMLTQRKSLGSHQTWQQDIGVVLQGQFSEAGAVRLKNAMKVLFKT